MNLKPLRERRLRRLKKVSLNKNHSDSASMPSILRSLVGSPFDHPLFCQENCFLAPTMSMFHDFHAANTSAVEPQGHQKFPKIPKALRILKKSLPHLTSGSATASNASAEPISLLASFEMCLQYLGSNLGIRERKKQRNTFSKSRSTGKNHKDSNTLPQNIIYQLHNII